MAEHPLSVAPHVVDIQVDGVWLIVDPVQERIYALNTTASVLWAALRQGEDWEEAARSLARHTAVPPSEALNDARNFVRDLMARGLVTSADDEARPTPSSSGSSLPESYVPPAIDLALPLESRAGSPLRHDPDPLLDPLSPFRLGSKKGR